MIQHVGKVDETEIKHPSERKKQISKWLCSAFPSYYFGETRVKSPQRKISANGMISNIYLLKAVFP